MSVQVDSSTPIVNIDRALFDRLKTMEIEGEIEMWDYTALEPQGFCLQLTGCRDEIFINPELLHQFVLSKGVNPRRLSQSLTNFWYLIVLRLVDTRIELQEIDCERRPVGRIFSIPA
ncbi:TPA: hypothetical protein DF272_00435 [Candidatus Falkowbacteria bacterium]|nr:hypothetical protein [Candidatus Falkowbacteria bacterium]